MLKEYDGGVSAPELARKYGIAENTKLKHLLAEAMLDNAALNVSVWGTWSGPRSGGGPWNIWWRAASAVSAARLGWSD